jgi:polyisoprenyl-teichoic acid--peptidoglycan teichoic acid transferase
MERKRAQRREKTLSDWLNKKRFRSPKQGKDSKRNGSIPVTKRHSSNSYDIYQSTLFPKTFRFRAKQSSGFYFGRGLLWGGIIGFTVIFSASCGVALTKIDAVERTIATTIKRHSVNAKSFSSNSLTRPVNILLLEVEPSQNEIIEFSQSLVGQSKTVLLLQFNPQLNTVKIINIPVNSRVKIPKFGWGTLADANKYGGTSLVSQMVIQLLGGVEIDRYFRATPSTFNKLIASGKITLNNCHFDLENCDDPNLQISRQQTAVETIRQRLNIPTYFQSFQTTLGKTQADLDTNLSLREAMSVANFVKELEPDNIEVNLVPGYRAGQALDINHQLYKSQSSEVETAAGDRNNSSLDSFSWLKDAPIAVQNKTDSPELGMRMATYLRQQNFHDVYLVEQIPLKLDKTKIIIHNNIY